MDHSSSATPPISSGTPNGNRPSVSTLEASSGSSESKESSFPYSIGCSIVSSPPPTVDSPPPFPESTATTTPPPTTSLPADEDTAQQSDPASSLNTCACSTMTPVLLKEGSSDHGPVPPSHLGAVIKPFSVGPDVVVWLSRLSLRDSNHKGSAPCSSLKTPPPPAIGTELGKENVLPHEVSTATSCHSSHCSPITEHERMSSIAHCCVMSPLPLQTVCPPSVEVARRIHMSSTSFLVEDEVHFSSALSPSRSSTPCVSVRVVGVIGMMWKVVRVKCERI